jgi:hypothetical protein
MDVDDDDDLQPWHDMTPNEGRVRACLLSFLVGPAPNVTEARRPNPRTLVVVGVPPVRIDQRAGYMNVSPARSPALSGIGWSAS